MLLFCDHLQVHHCIENNRAQISSFTLEAGTPYVAAFAALVSCVSSGQVDGWDLHHN